MQAILLCCSHIDKALCACYSIPLKGPIGQECLAAVARSCNHLAMLHHHSQTCFFWYVCSLGALRSNPHWQVL